jgi:ADP-ribose pyrophosphatase YjhB (NUDIX family)
MYNYKEPITSYGILAYTTKDHPNYYSSIYLENLIKNKCIYKRKSNVKFLMIQRATTMGFIDIIRGRYKYNNILSCFNEMTFKEKEILRHWSFDEIWNFCWLNKNSRIYKSGYKYAYEKFKRLDVNYYLKKSKNIYDFCEFSIPKGKKKNKESILDCAKREFFEETGYNNSHYTLMDYPLITEEFIGTDNVFYKHVYFLAQLPKLNKNNMLQCGEVSNIGLLTLSECVTLIRPYDTCKKQVLKNVSADILS